MSAVKKTEKAGSMNKSKMIREAMAENPSATPAAIAEALQAKGCKVSAQYVSTVKFNSQRSKKPRLRPRMMPSVAHRTAGAKQLPMQEIDAALAFIKSAGGLTQAKQMLTTIEQIAQAI